jgi:Domain of unknown function (DUF5606)
LRANLLSTMTLSEIATITGKSTLYKVLKPGKAGVILESLDDTKTKIVANATHRLSVLSEISIYTTTKEGTVPLEDVLKKINKEYGADLGLDADAANNELKAFLKSVVPDYDESRVYVSDMKKLVRWYGILLKQVPEIFSTEAQE